MMMFLVLVIWLFVSTQLRAMWAALQHAEWETRRFSCGGGGDSPNGWTTPSGAPILTARDRIVPLRKDQVRGSRVK